MKAEMAKRLYSLHEGDRPYTDFDIRLMSEYEQLEFITSWFRENYVKPPSVPYDGSNGGHQFLNRFPISVADILENEFSAFVEYPIIQRAKEELDEEESDWFAVLDDEPNSNENARLAELQRTLSSLRIELERYRAKTPGIGHNQPPENVSEAPLSSDEIDTTISATHTINAYATSDVPQSSAPALALDHLKQASTKVSTWLGQRMTNGIDAFVKGAATAAGASAVLYWDRIRILLQRVLELAQGLF